MEYVQIWMNVVLIVLLVYMIYYVRAKAEGLAKQEDVSKITRLIEEVKAGFSKSLQEHSASLDLANSLKLAALDKRLEKHQEAYSLWQDLLRSMPDKERTLGKVLECQEWWKQNCLYLGDKARESFRIAFRSADLLNSLSDSSNEREKCFEKIMVAGKHIEEGVALIALPPPDKKL